MTLGTEVRGGTPVRKISGGHLAIPEINIALLGALGVGKSALTVKYLTKRFINEYDPDLEDTYNRIDLVGNHEVLMHIMDTCDKECRDAERYLKWADVFVVIYSLTSRTTFDQAHEYLEMLQSSKSQAILNPECPVLLVGNKLDLERYRQISKAEGSDCASKYDAYFLETTAAEEYNETMKVFHEAVKLALKEQQDHPDRVVSKTANGHRSIMTNHSRLLHPNNGVFHRRTDERTFADRNNAKFKIFNKGFKIFQS